MTRTLDKTLWNRESHHE